MNWLLVLLSLMVMNMTMIMCWWRKRKQGQELRRVGSSRSRNPWTRVKIETLVCNGSLFFFHCWPSHKLQCWNWWSHHHIVPTLVIVVVQLYLELSGRGWSSLMELHRVGGGCWFSGQFLDYGSECSGVSLDECGVRVETGLLDFEIFARTCGGVVVRWRHDVLWWVEWELMFVVIKMKVVLWF